jgi:hypothetical protein
VREEDVMERIRGVAHGESSRQHSGELPENKLVSTRDPGFVPSEVH